MIHWLKGNDLQEVKMSPSENINEVNDKRWRKRNVGVIQNVPRKLKQYFDEEKQWKDRNNGIQSK